MMDLCSSGHEEICYESMKCPLCIEIKEREAAEKELEITKESLSEANEKVEELLIEHKPEDI